MKKFIADANALLNHPEIIESYPVVITSHVLREIEQLERKKSDRSLQFEIRRLKRFLDSVEHSYFDLKDYKFTLNKDFDGEYVDNILLQIAVENGFGVITNDRLLKEKCKLYGIEVIDTENRNYVEFKGYKQVHMLPEELNDLYANLSDNKYNLLTNEYLAVYDDITGECVDVLKWNGTAHESLRNRKGKLDNSFKTQQFGQFKPKDEFQMMAIDSILHNQLTCIRGRAGSGKSLIALHTAWKLVESEGYRLVVFANPTPLRDSQELGFYKGDRLEKLLQSSVGTMLASKFGDEIEIMRQIQHGNLEILPFVDLRGYDSGDRKTIVWIIEAQNLTTDLLKIGLQRISENTKVIVDGDYDAQVDKDVYAMDNGMKRMSEVFRGSDLYGEIELQVVYRSRLAEMADKM